MVRGRLTNKGKCRSCGAALMWIDTEAGRRMPVNPGPVYYHVTERGESFINARGVTQKGVRCVSTSPGARVGFKTHWQSCPGANNFRNAG